VGWDHDASEYDEPRSTAGTPLTAQLLALFAEPGVHSLTAARAASAIARPEAEIENALDALAQAGELVRRDDGIPRYAVTEARKAQLEHMFTEAAHELGETQALMRRDPTPIAVYDDDDEPRLPVTAGLLSLFLPGTGQLLNGDVGRASLVFAVWSLALLTHLSPIWTFVALYAGAEAFFTAKVRGIERRLELEASPPPRELGPSET
jgi:TM2 domain-containing membrane protein YozV